MVVIFNYLYYPGLALKDSNLPVPIDAPLSPACRFLIGPDDGITPTHFQSTASYADSHELPGSVADSSHQNGPRSDSNSNWIAPGTVSGEFLSPAHPGIHPPGLVCAYRFIGYASQRISIDIIEFGMQQKLGS
ncbi:unnamed protein product [Protopolystoma xenopodis]|uniref:CUB domain-containing protein n=1 Tax=Protopolystoma xenopodis TaxID=117903 RepID=A0A448X809_9PLAT|nr:unnamed protein product [Protopolystoma xenopodis]